MTHSYVAMRKSGDFGSTWGALTEVPGTAIPCAHGLRTHADVIFDSVRNATVLLSQHQRVPCCKHPWEIMKPLITVTKSTDSGATWTVSESPLPGLELNAYVSPGGGIQLKHGPHAGRLVAVAQTPNTSWTGPGGKERPNDCASNDCDIIFFSDDGGDSWRRATPTIERNDEASLVELSDGTLLMSLRGAYAGSPVNMSPKRRQIHSTDGGSSWLGADRPAHPRLWQRFVLRLAGARGRYSTFFASVRSRAEATCWKHGRSSGWPGLARCNGTLFTSQDEGGTWQPWLQATGGNASQFFAYSDMTVLQESEPPSLGLFYETSSVNGGCEGPSCSLIFKRFPLPPSSQNAAVAE
jgi:sialidase-1